MGPPLPNIFEREKNKGKLHIILKGIYQKFRINLNRKFIRFSDFASLVSKIAFVRILVKLSKFFFWYDVMKSGSIRQTKLSEISKIAKTDSHFIFI